MLREGEVRYSWTDQDLITTPAYELTKYTFTGQYSYMDDPSTTSVTEGFGLMYYNARWYDPALGRFAQADSIIPGAGDPQAWDRYAYAYNNPLKYNDPSGHSIDCAVGESGCIVGVYVSPSVLRLAKYAIDNEYKTINRKYLYQVATHMAYTLDYVIPAYGDLINRPMTAYVFATFQQESLWGTQMVESCLDDGLCGGNTKVSEEDYYNSIYGGDWGEENLGNKQPGDGYLYRGRGFTHFTGRSIYTYLTALLQTKGSIDKTTSFTETPNLLASNWQLSARASVFGMYNGLFTGRGLPDYDGSSYNFNGARDIVNPRDFIDRNTVSALAVDYFNIMTSEGIP